MLVSQTEIRAAHSDGYLLPTNSRNGDEQLQGVTIVNARDYSVLLFMTQSHHGVHTHRAPRRYVARRQRHEQ